jgi:hypothetical protein
MLVQVRPAIDTLHGECKCDRHETLPEMAIKRYTENEALMQRGG